MRKTIRITALVLALLIIGTILAGCGSTKILSGTYTNGIDLTIVGTKLSYTFKGNKVTISSTTTVFGNERTQSWDGTYQIIKNDDEKESIKFEFKDEDAKAYTGTFSFSQGKDADGKEIINIGLTQLTKK